MSYSKDVMYKTPDVKLQTRLSWFVSQTCLIPCVNKGQKWIILNSHVAIFGFNIHNIQYSLVLFRLLSFFFFDLGFIMTSVPAILEGSIITLKLVVKMTSLQHWLAGAQDMHSPFKPFNSDCPEQWIKFGNKKKHQCNLCVMMCITTRIPEMLGHFLNLNKMYTNIIKKSHGPIYYSQYNIDNITNV